MALSESLATGCLLPILLALTACSGVIGDQQLRGAYLERFIAQPEHLVLVSSLPLHGESQLELFGLGDPGERLARQFDLDHYATGLAQRFIAQSPEMSGSSLIMRPGDIGQLPAGLDGNEPVLLLHSNWRLLYRRWPPDMRLNMVQLGVVARVVPLGLVLSGKGLLQLPDAAWQAHCVHEARGGAYLSLDEWAANDAARLRGAIAEAQQQCARELATDFAKALPARN